MKLQKKDFIEIEFTGKIKDGEVFDSNIKEDLEKLNPELKAKPFAFCLGQDMFLKSVDEFLIGKDIGEYEIELTPEKAFGKRDAKLVQMMPMKVFKEQKTMPVAGMVFNFDNKMGKILSASGGRVLVDFNNPLAGKEVVYKIKILRKIEKLDEKIKALNEFLFKKDFEFEIKDTLKGTSKKLILKVEKQMIKFIELFKDKFKEILDLDLEVKELEEKKQEVKKVEEKKKEDKEEEK